MNALQSYSSDEDGKDESPLKIRSNMTDANYDDVGMDISEDSGDEEKKETTDEKSPQPADQKKIDDSADTDDKKPSDSASIKESSHNEHSERDNRKHEDGSHKEKESNSHYGSDYKGSSASSRRDSDRRHHGSSHEYKDSRESKDYRRGGRDDERRRDDRYRRSRSRERRRSRSRSKSPRSRGSHQSSRRRSRERSKPYDSRRDGYDRSNSKNIKPLIDPEEMAQRGYKVQREEIEKQTGITLPTYYNPAVMNPLKIAEQERKKKLLWGNKSKVAADSTSNVVPTSSSGPAPVASNTGQHWAQVKFQHDQDGKMSEKFRRLMGVKDQSAAPIEEKHAAGAGSSRSSSEDVLKEQEKMFNKMERQYEMARMATHTYKGFGLGFSSQNQQPPPYVPK